MPEPDWTEKKTVELTRGDWRDIGSGLTLCILQNPDLEYKARLEKALEGLTGQVTE